MISGSSSHCGKTTFTLLLLECLRRSGLRLGYLKPTTQCEAESIVTKYCKNAGVRTKPSSVVFYKGFTRSYISGDTETSSEMLSKISADVDSSFRDCDLVILDGVGYPSVGSITGCSNADVARSCGASALLVTPPGVGHAVDSFGLNAAYFRYGGVEVVGGVVNMCEPEGFYSVDACHQWCLKSLQSKGERLFGALPKFESLIDLRDSGSEEEWLSKHLDGVAREFEERVDVASIVNELEKIERFRGYDRGSGGSSAAMMKPAVAVAVSLPINVATETSPFFSGGVGLKPLGRPAPFPAPGPERSAKVRRTREEIEKEAKAQGAKGG